MNANADCFTFLGSIHEQNLELFSFVLRCVSNGEPHMLHDAGLAESDVAQLQGLSLTQLMELSNRGMKLTTYLGEARRRRAQRGLSLALIEQRAPRELMMQLFRMSTRRFASLRMSLGVVGGRGRPNTALTDSAVEQRIWRLWVILADEIDPRQLRAADHWLLISLELPGYLRSAWSLIQRWVREPVSLAVFSGDRLRLGEAQCMSQAHYLLVKHQQALNRLLLDRAEFGSADA